MSLSNFQLEQLAEELKVPLKYITMKNELPHHAENGNYIINFESAPLPGSHWTALICKNSKAFYFDSFGQEPPNSILHFCKGKQLYYNDTIIQDLNSNLYGFYCLGLFKHISQFKNVHLLNSCNDYINMFDDDKNEVNGEILKKYLDRFSFSFKKYLMSHK